MNEHPPSIPATPQLSAHLDFFTLLRDIERVHNQQPRIGERNDNSLTYLKIVQQANMAFASREVARVIQGPKHIEVITRYFGLFAPYGPLPIYVTEHAHSEALTTHNWALQDFAGILSQRLATMYYRAWNQLNPIVGNDRGEENSNFINRLRHIAGVPSSSATDDPIQRLRLAWPAAWLPGRASLGTLQKMLSRYFSVPVVITPRSGIWVSDADASLHQRIGKLGSTRIGRRFYDVQHSITVVIGPLAAKSYQDYQRGRARILCMAKICHEFTNHQQVIDIQLRIKTSTDMAGKLGQARLGSSGWLRPKTGIYQQSVYRTAT